MTRRACDGAHCRRHGSGIYGGLLLSQLVRRPAGPCEWWAQCGDTKKSYGEFPQVIFNGSDDKYFGRGVDYSNKGGRMTEIENKCPAFAAICHRGRNEPMIIIRLSHSSGTYHSTFDLVVLCGNTYSGVHAQSYRYSTTALYFSTPYCSGPITSTL